MDRKDSHLTRRGFLKLAGMAGGTLAWNRFFDAFGTGSAKGVVHAQGGGPTPQPGETEAQRYVTMLQERLDADGNWKTYDGKNALVIRFSLEGRKAVLSQDPAQSWTPDSKQIADFSFIALMTGPAPYLKLGESLDRVTIAQYVEQMYGPAGPDQLKMRGESMLVDGGNGRFILNPAMRTDLELGSLYLAVPYEVFDAARIPPSEGSQLETEPIAARSESVVTAVPEPASAPAGMHAVDIPPQKPTERGELRDTLLKVLCGVMPAGLAILGLGWLIVGKKRDTGMLGDIQSRDSDKWTPPKSQDIAGGVIGRLTNQMFPDSHPRKTQD